MANVNTNDLMTPEEAAFLLDLKPATVQKHCWRGIIKGIKIGSSWMIHRKELDRFQKEKRPRGRPPKQA